jgi:hypothetical protein
MPIPRDHEIYLYLRFYDKINQTIEFDAEPTIKVYLVKRKSL